jgi:hypothetical protein
MAALSLMLESLYQAESQTLNLSSTLAFLVALFISLKTKADTLVIVGLGGLIGLILYFI